MEITGTGLINESVESIMRKGVLVDLNIGRWRASVNLSPADFFPGMTVEFYQNFRDLISGSKKLLPAEVNKRLGKIEGKVRSCLQDISYKTLWGHFVPFSMFPQFVELFEEKKVEYHNAATEIAGNLLEYKERITAKYRAMLTEQIKEPLTVDRIVAEIMSKFIELDAYMNKINFSYSFITVSPQTVIDSLPESAKQYYDPKNVYDTFMRETMGEYISLVRETLLDMLAKLKEDKLKQVIKRIEKLKNLGSKNVFGITMSELDEIETALRAEDMRRAQQVGEEMYARFGKLEIEGQEA